MNKKLFSLLFFLSGLCGLMYQILWTRLFSFVLGNTYLAISMIVASFMFGLFFGSWLIGRYIVKLRNPLQWYAILEIAIGAYALLLLFLFGIPEAIFKGLYSLLSGIEILHLLGKFLVTLVLIALPTSAMGATLPLAVHYFTKNKKLFGDNISLFYAVNTVGGAIGVLVAGFYLIEHLGIHNGLIATACLNIGIGVIVLLALQKSPVIAEETPEPQTKKPKDKKKKQPATAAPNRVLYLAAAGLAGFAALSYEIIWTRGLKFLIHNSTYSFTVILFVFLLGIAIGSRIAERVFKSKKDLHYFFGLFQTILGLYAIFTIYLLYSFSYSDFFQNNVVEIMYDYSYSWHWAILVYCLICSMMFLVPTLLMGILFPVINELFFEKNPRPAGKTVSSIFAANTIGGIGGSLAAGIFLLPAFGIKTSIILISVINLLLGVIFVFKSRLRIQPTLVTASAVFVFVYLLSFDGQYLFGRGEKEGDRVLFYKEGLMATVKVFNRNTGRFMSIDGNIIASTHQTLHKKEKLIAHLPFFVRSDIKDVLAVGLASGISVGSMGLHESVEKIDCVELIKPVFPASRYFTNFNYNIFENDKIDLIHNDIYAHLVYHDKKYDLISSDGKLGTLYSGNTIMLSTDFYELSKKRLKEDGVFIQWLPIITPHKALKVILNTLKKSFKHVSLFYFYPTDIFMLASEKPMFLDKSHMDKVFSNPEIKRDLGLFKITDSIAILSSYMGPYDDKVDPETRINSFDRPYLEFAYMRQWKNSKKWEGGYRAKNLQYLVENFENTDFEQLSNLVQDMDESSLNQLVKGSRLFFKGCINYFKTGHLQNSFREYYEFRSSAGS
ncbi:hypothetical protein GWO43_07350 [candidate division KSB1 bacterium]|nr:hypothetical protein [candidate division KSB1 bacterium]NIR72976.1 hypothetical protein [candidate division KSB1 bacterium]NIS23782.1 hypothetical protein [candidate division KSB1 bacterium]NIT70701.1 hypothetical protein [candidate division KSB1 bacterium]NIU24432.1 hypothetical protein [candidate division KSB1 bacterium]